MTDGDFVSFSRWMEARKKGTDTVSLPDAPLTQVPFRLQQAGKGWYLNWS